MTINKKKKKRHHTAGGFQSPSNYLILLCNQRLGRKIKEKKKDHDCKVVQVTNTKEAVDYQEERPLRASCLSVHQSVSPRSASAQGGKNLTVPEKISSENHF